jgi:hypothetical protein
MAAQASKDADVLQKPGTVCGFELTDPRAAQVGLADKAYTQCNASFLLITQPQDLR